MKHMRMNIWRYAAAMLFCLAIAAGLTATALAKGQSSITYIDENGAEHKVTDYKILTYSDSDVYLQSGTYVTTNFGSDAETIRGIINIQGDVIIIIRNYLRFQGVWIQPDSSLTIYEEKGREATITCNTIDGMAPEGFSGYGRLILCSGKVYASSEVRDRPAFGTEGGVFIKGGKLNAGSYGDSLNVPAIGGSGPVLISGGEVDAFSLKSAAIGSSDNITITGGNISASSQLNSGIGGANGKSANILITGGKVVAIAHTNSAGIGNGEFVRGGSINISGGDVNASGYTGIGAGFGGRCGSIAITGGTVNAKGKYYGIGSGFTSKNSLDLSSDGNIEITGGNVTASSESENTSGIDTRFAPGKKLILGWTSPSDRISGSFKGNDYRPQNVEWRNYFYLGNESTVAYSSNLDQRTLIPYENAVVHRVRFYSHNKSTPWRETLLFDFETLADPGDPYANEPDKQFNEWRVGGYNGPAASFGNVTEDLELYAACRIPVTLRYNNGRADETPVSQVRICV